MKGRILLVMFSLPFVGIGTIMGWSMGSNIAQARQMRTWQPVSAELVRGISHAKR